MLARVPLLEHSAAAAAVQAYGGKAQADRLLDRAGRGELVLTVAAQGRTGREPAELAVTARREGPGWLLDGVQTAVPWAYDADLVVVPAHLGARGPAGPCWRWCRARRRGWSSPSRYPPAVNGWPSCGCGRCGSVRTR